MTLLPVPALMFGFVLGRLPTVMLYSAFGIGSGLVGAGLLRLDNRARLGAYGMMLVGLLNFLVLATPWGRARSALYNQEILARMNFPGRAAQPNPSTNGEMMALTIALCALLYGAQVWATQRYRGSFRMPPL